MGLIVGDTCRAYTHQDTSITPPPEAASPLIAREYRTFSLLSFWRLAPSACSPGPRLRLPAVTETTAGRRLTVPGQQLVIHATC